MRLKGGKKKRAGFFHSQKMFFLYAHPQVECAREAETENEPIVHPDFKFSEELLEINGHVVLFLNADGEMMLHVVFQMGNLGKYFQGKNHFFRRMVD